MVMFNKQPIVLIYYAYIDITFIFFLISFFLFIKFCSKMLCVMLCYFQHDLMLVCIYSSETS